MVPTRRFLSQFQSFAAPSRFSVGVLWDRPRHPTRPLPQNCEGERPPLWLDCTAQASNIARSRRPGKLEPFACHAPLGTTLSLQGNSPPTLKRRQPKVTASEHRLCSEIAGTATENCWKSRESNGRRFARYSRTEFCQWLKQSSETHFPETPTIRVRPIPRNVPRDAYSPRAVD